MGSKKKIDHLVHVSIAFPVKLAHKNLSFVVVKVQTHTLEKLLHIVCMNDAIIVLVKAVGEMGRSGCAIRQNEVKSETN